MSAPTIAATTVITHTARPLPELPDLGACGDCGLDLVCLAGSSDVVFCERCDLGLPLAGRTVRR